MIPFIGCLSKVETPTSQKLKTESRKQPRRKQKFGKQKAEGGDSILISAFNFQNFSVCLEISI
jgi:hypothetical protein